MATAYITHPACSDHDMGDDHPESPQRLAAINDALIQSGVMDFLQYHTAPSATDEQLALAHTIEHINHVKSLVPERGLAALDPDTYMNSHSLSAARHAAGAAILGCDLVMAGDVTSAFCAVRPPGHHAEKPKAMGFCIFNNVAVAAHHLLKRYKLTRIAVLDFDVHHGNGTEDIFKNDTRVLLCSSFQHPLYPHTAVQKDTGNILHVPLPAGTNSADFRSAIRQHWLPALAHFQPQFILISAGFDAHKLDPLANLNLSEGDFGWITDEIKTVAARYANGRIVSTLEGGYDLHALGVSVVAHLRSLASLGNAF